LIPICYGAWAATGTLFAVDNARTFANNASKPMGPDDLSRYAKMEVMKNKASGKFFVVLDDTGGPDFLAITPEGKIRRLERHLFVPQDTTGSGEAVFKTQLTKSQVDLYAEYSGEM
jgi:hypothetical protein